MKKASVKINTAGVPLKLVFRGPYSYSESRNVATGSGGRKEVDCGIISHEGDISGSFTFHGESASQIGNQIRFLFGKPVSDAWLRGLSVADEQSEDTSPKIVIFGNELTAVIHYDLPEYLDINKVVKK